MLWALAMKYCAKTAEAQRRERNIGTLPILFHQINQEIWKVSLYS